MKPKEVVELLVIITAAYPNMQISEAMVKLWHELLEDIDFNLAKTAVKKLILESPYPPTIADIRKHVMEITTPPEDRIDAAEAWGEVLRAIRHHGYYCEKEALESMSPRTAKVVRYMGWREICLSEDIDVVRGQFIKMYNAVAEREKQERLLPAALKEDIQKLASKMNLKMIEGERAVM